MSAIGLVLIGLAGATIYSKLIKPSLDKDNKIFRVFPKLPGLSLTKDETANWKTYTNSKYKFSFKYPPDWEIPPDLSEGYPEQNFVLLYKNYNEIVLGITENIESVSQAKKAIYGERADSLDFEFGDTKIGNLVFKGPVFSEGRVPEQEGEWLNFIIHKNILYAFSVDTDNPDEDFETFNQILSTFQFID